MCDRVRTSLRRSVLLLLLLGASIAHAPAALAQDDTFPEDAARAFDLYERQYPLEDWLDGPVQYIILGYERDLWNDIEDDEGRQEFKAWFWGRRDPDPRDGRSEDEQERFGVRRRGRA